MSLLPAVPAELAPRTNGTPLMTRHIVVVDTETNGLDPSKHQAVEVAWWDLTTDARGWFIPVHDVSTVLAEAELKALQINRYIDRIASLVPTADDSARHQLHTVLATSTLVGSNPAFDAAMLRKLFQRDPATEQMAKNPTPWHHRMLDLSAYAAGVLGLDELPGLATVCALLDVEPGDHTAKADVTATGLCIRRLQRIAAERKQAVAA